MRRKPQSWDGNPAKRRCYPKACSTSCCGSGLQGKQFVQPLSDQRGWDGGGGGPFLSLYYEVVGTVAWSPQCPEAGISFWDAGLFSVVYGPCYSVI